MNIAQGEGQGSSSDEEQLDSAYHYDEEYYRQKIIMLEDYERLRLQLIDKVVEINTRLRQ